MLCPWWLPFPSSWKTCRGIYKIRLKKRAEKQFADWFSSKPLLRGGAQGSRSGRQPNARLFIHNLTSSNTRYLIQFIIKAIRPERKRMGMKNWDEKDGRLLLSRMECKMNGVTRSLYYVPGIKRQVSENVRCKKGGKIEKWWTEDFANMLLRKRMHED